MTKSQQIILLFMVIMLLGVTALLAYTLVNTKDTAPAVPTLAVLSTVTAPPVSAADADSTPAVAPPTWTSEPTRTPPASSTPRGTHTAIPSPTITPTFLPTFTPRPTEIVTPTPPALTATIGLQNPGFENVAGDVIPGWSWWAEDNFEPGGAYSPDTSYDTPLFKQADDAVRFISGPTLQIDGVQHLKFKTHVFQTVPVSPTASVGFQVLASAFSDTGSIKVAAGIDPAGGQGCDNAQWSEFRFLDQGQAVQPIVAPEVVAGPGGRVTVCLYAEPLYAAVSNAAFFDDAELTVKPLQQSP
jgi:hypothetical protein